MPSNSRALQNSERVPVGAVSKGQAQNILFLKKITEEDMSLLRCPFLARQPMSIIRTKSTHLMSLAPKCPVMSRVLNASQAANQLHTSGI